MTEQTFTKFERSMDIAVPLPFACCTHRKNNGHRQSAEGFLPARLVGGRSRFPKGFGRTEFIIIYRPLTRRYPT